MKGLILNITTPKGTLGPVTCDSIRLTISEDPKGKSGGSYGIRPGHAKALLALGKGPVKAFLSGRILLSGEGSGGFATVDKDTVTIVTEEFLSDKET